MVNDAGGAGDAGGMAVASGSALVVRVDFGACTLMDEAGELLDATVRARVMGRRKALGNTVVVGDLAEWTREGERIVIGGVAPRRNLFSRRAAGERAEEQVVAANLDQIVLVATVRDPEFKAGFVDRVLAQASHQGIAAVLVLNKADLGGGDEARAVLGDYARAGCAGLFVSAREGAEIEHLRHSCRARRTLFVGHSGVGKSTLLNALFPDLELRAGEVNKKTGKGRHTTTAAWLVRPEAGLELIDTPGVRGFGLWGIGARELDHAYPEFRPFLGECRFADCRHVEEPGCAIRGAATSGTIAMRRFESFLKLREELEAESGDDPRRPRTPRSHGGARS